MKYRIVFDKPAEKYIRKQPKKQQERLLHAIRLLPEIGDIKPMEGHKGLFRLRVGEVRVLYTIEDDVLVIRILDVGNRGDVYK